MHEAIVNIAAYRFVRLDDLSKRRSKLRSRCDALELKGTILLSPEGINLFLAGAGANVDAFMEELQQDERLSGLTVKRSVSNAPPFARMKVKLKREIIPFGIAGIDPRREPAPNIAPRQLRRWLDEGRDLLLLDVRNNYEIEHGTFAGAQSLGINHFRELPAAVDDLDAQARQRPVVMFCTGGIRCEKAGAYLKRQGFADVHQLEGGILKYFEECGDAHFEGNCFVFDERIAVDPGLRPLGGS